MSTGRKQTDSTPQNPTSKSAAKPKPASEIVGWPAWARGLVSLLLVWHLAAIFLAPFSQPPTSRLVAFLAQNPVVRAYTDPLYLNHGYSFFAPEPGPGHVIEYTLFDSTGNQLETSRFPSKREQWPRLNYHRFMMLADQLDAFPSEELREPRAKYMLTNYALQILREHPTADRAIARRLVHFMPTRADFLNGVALDDPKLWSEEYSVTQTRADLVQAEARSKQLPRSDSDPEPELITPGSQP